MIEMSYQLIKHNGEQEVKFLTPIYHAEIDFRVHSNVSVYGRSGIINSQSPYSGKSVKKYDGTVAVITCKYLDIYYHWLFDLLPKIKILQQGKISFDVLYIPEAKFQFQKDTLKKIDSIVPIIFANEDTIITANRVIEVDAITTNLIPPDWIYGHIKSEFGSLDCQVVTYRRIYISRRYAKNRRVLNEDSLIPIFDKYGIKRVFLEFLSFSEQVAIFRSAELIIAPHGSGLTNLVFSNNYAKIIELKGPLCAEECFARLAIWAGLDYLAIDCPKKGYRSFFHKIMSFASFRNFYYWDFIVDPLRLKSTLEISI